MKDNMYMTSLRHRIALLTLLGLMAIPAFAQGRTEIGVIGLVTSYRKVNVTGPERSGKVGPTWGPAVGFVIGQSMGDHWGGELRYVYFQNDIELQSGGESTEFSAQSHAVQSGRRPFVVGLTYRGSAPVHYDVLYYLTDQDSTVRPFVAAGIGLKHYRGTGDEQSFQPLSDLALLTHTTQTVLAGDVGVGVKVRIGGSALVRFEFRDYITKVPDKIIAASIDSEVSDILHHWAPLFGISWTF